MPQYHFDAFIFDLDGVVTQTALVHSAAWKNMFDEFLKAHAQQHGEAFAEFTHQQDYLPFVDGKPRYKGVASFLESRHIQIPFGEPHDDPHLETICALGNRKDIAFRQIVQKEGVKEYPTTIALIKQLKQQGIKVGVASSSKNCRLVLESSGLADLFETRVDGEVSTELGLSGKPRPDIFTVAADNLHVSYDRTVIVEDAVSGVQAGREGNFGLVLGIAREENHHELKINGADIVVADLGEITLESVEKWFTDGIPADGWQLDYHDYDRGKEAVRESLLTVGNGTFGTRGAAEEMKANGTNYPGSYIAGLYNRLSSKVADRIIYNDDFVNIPNWLYTTFKIGDGPWCDLNVAKLISYDRTLLLKTGQFEREYVVEDDKGQRTRITSRRIASMADPHVAALSYQVTPLNYSATITIRTGLDGNIINANVERYKQLNAKHLDCVTQGVNGNQGYITLRTNQSKVDIAEAMKLTVRKAGVEVPPVYRHEVNNGSIYHEFSSDLQQGETLAADKVVAIFASRDHAVQVANIAQQKIQEVGDYETVYAQSRVAWQNLWDQMDITIVGDRLAQKLLRLHIFHTMVTASMHSVELDTSIPARGLHGEAYRGHIFWDELFVLPFYNLHFPEITKATLLYRYRRLPQARTYAREFGYKGAMFPWQSSSRGGEETQTIHLNPLTGKWGDDYSSYQRHVSLAIALNVWQYFQATDDRDFMSKYGTEMLLSISQFFSSMTHHNIVSGRYEIKNVMGPDEYHEHHANSPKGGLKDNSYTNIMLAWLLDKTLAALQLLGSEEQSALLSRVALSEEDLSHWRELTKKLNLIIKDGVIAQFDGYFELPELPWEEYRVRYGNIHRMDRILKAEGKTPDEFKVAKQADVMMTFYNLPLAEVTKILRDLSYNPQDQLLKTNFDYYLARTSHGSTLSKIVHASLANSMGNAKLSFELYFDALQSDYRDAQGGTTGEGIHAGVMTSTVLVALSSYAGLDLRNGEISCHPRLPSHWRSIKFGFQHRGDLFTIEVSPTQLILTGQKLAAARTLQIFGEHATLQPGETKIFNTGVKK